MSLPTIGPLVEIAANPYCKAKGKQCSELAKKDCLVSWTG